MRLDSPARIIYALPHDDAVASIRGQDYEPDPLATRDPPGRPESRGSPHRSDLGVASGNYIGLPLGHWGFSLVDDGPRTADASRRYRIVWYEHPCGMCVAFSPDGLRFRKHDGNPVIPTTLPGSDANNIGDILDICFDPLSVRLADGELYALDAGPGRSQQRL